ncbi:sister chromatid cohesion 1 protein 1 [Arachis stenosperma]|uniref:sister chromatid cohesion 1 protein 1 n=1 Tax=Arachis stenosperma TaxID=217475 RepID=UPI0025ABED91|nr:sister chromatid cohesion 1 protein 1 [Arachis stenosperma]
MFYSHQLLARKAPLGQIWMAATMHAKINRRKLDKLNIIKICEEILNPSVPMALRLSGILMGGVVIVYERKVKLLYDDVTRFLAEINEAWKVKSVPHPTVLPKGKSKAKKEAVTLPEIEDMNIADVESLQFSNTATTMGFQPAAYFTMRLDNVDETAYFDDGARGEEAQSEHLHQADAENITLFERTDSFNDNMNPFNRFERFDIKDDEETQVNGTSGGFTQIPTTLVPSPPHQCEPTRDDVIHDQQHAGDPIIQQCDVGRGDRQERGRPGPTKRKRRQPVGTAMDYEQTIIPVHIYQHWLQNASDLVSKRGRKRKRTDIMSSTKISNLMKLPPLVLIGGLFTSENRDVYYPAPILDLWNKSIQPPKHSPSERTSASNPSVPSSSSPPGVLNEDFVGNAYEDLDNVPQDQPLMKSVEKQRARQPKTPPDVQWANLPPDVQWANLGNGVSAPEVTSTLPSGKSGDGNNSNVRSDSEPDYDSRRDKRKKNSSSGNSSRDLEGVEKKGYFHRSGGLESLVEEKVAFHISRRSGISSTPDQELIVETGPTQTPVKMNHPSDKMTDSIQLHLRAHFSTSGAPHAESLNILAAGMDRKKAALLFYSTCVLASRDAIRVQQKVSYGEILISRGSKM